MALNLNFNKKAAFQAAMKGYCMELLHQGYDAMLKSNSYDVDWTEDSLTAHYIQWMNELPLRKEQQILIIAQYPIYAAEHTTGLADANKAPRIDFRFVKWSEHDEYDYFAEAKNLSQTKWKKKDGTPVNSAYYYKRYVETGITHLLSGHYPNNCCLIAYVVNGKKAIVIDKLNRIIADKFKDLGQIENHKLLRNDLFYSSENCRGTDKITLTHLFLQLS